MQIIIYALVTLFATLMGSIAGMGGGVIIKPVFDAFEQYDAVTVGVITSITVFAMALVSISRQIAMKTKIDPKAGAVLCGGSIAGGYAGQFALGQVDALLQNNELLVVTQNVMLFVLIICVVLYMAFKSRIRSLNTTKPLPVLLCGLILGTLSSFLGIGGGPFNVAIILFVIGCDTRMAAVYSILTILFSQLSKLVTVALTTGYAQYDLGVLPVIVLCGVAGGFLGAKLNKSLPDKAVDRCFHIMQIIILCITLSNIVRYGLRLAA